jgi:hypothetical protein
MGYAIVAGGLLLLYFGAKGGSALGTAATAIAGAARGQVKLGNADPNFEPWLVTELEKLIGPHSTAVAFRDSDPPRQSAASREGVAKAIRARRIIDYDSQATARRSAGISIASPQGIGKIAGLGVQGAEIGLNLAGKAVAAVPIIGSAIGIVNSIIGVFTAHHAAAVQAENSTLNTTIPQVNQALDQLETAYRSGQLGGAQMKGALEQLYQSFLAALTAISQPAVFDAAATIAAHHCNAGCTEERALRGILDAMELFDY